MKISDKIGDMKREIRPYKPKTAEQRKNISKGVLKKIHEQESYTLYSPVKFESTIEYLKEYIEKFGNAAVPSSYVCEDGYPLGRTMERYKQKMREFEEKGTRRLSSKKYMMLKELGVPTERYDPYGPAIDVWEKYYNENGYYYIPKDYSCPDVNLYERVRRIMKLRMEGRLTADYSRRLDEMGVPKRWSKIKSDYKEIMKVKRLSDQALGSLK